MQEPGMGPGLVDSGRDPTPLVGLAFAAVGWFPTSWYAAVFGVAHFGPLAFPAILAMVGVLFGTIAVLRSIDTANMQTRKLGLLALSLGLVRLFVQPLVG